MLTLIPFADRAGWSFPEIGHVHAIAIDRGRVAIAWEGADGGHRVGIYDQHTHTQLARFDGVRFPPNDLAFHPERAELAIATGNEDGGYEFYNGELLVWNWETGASREALADRDVLRVAYRGDRLVVVVSQRDDGERLPDIAFALDDPSRKVAPAEYGFADDDAHAAARLANAAAIGLPARRAATDIAWLADGRLAIALDSGVVELWRPSTGEVATARIPDVTYAHPTLHVSPSRGLLVDLVAERSSRVYRLAADDTLALDLHFEGTHAFAMDASGRMLARSQVESFVIAPEGTVRSLGGLGSFHHYTQPIRVEGARDLYYTADKELHAIAADGARRALVAWDQQRHGTVVDDRLVARTGPGMLELVDLATGALRWRAGDLPGEIVALAHWPAAGCLVAGTDPARLLAFDLATGAVIHDEPFAIDGVEAIICAIAPHDEALALATRGGRVRVVALR